MRIRHILVALAALAFTSNSISAQDLDPTVVINKTYSGKLREVYKPVLEMPVPDSLKSFDRGFDYSIFDQPYKVAGGFTPYFLTMKPSPKVPESMKLYLKAGAGYTLNPTLDLVWSPLRSRALKMDVYALHRSYVGNYVSYTPGSDHWWGYDLMSRAGVDGRYEHRAFSANFDVSYFGLASKDQVKDRMYDALDVKVGLSSKPKSGSYFRYDIAAAYRFAEDKINYFEGGKDYVGEHLVNVDASLGQVMRWGHQILMDVETDVTIYSTSVVGQLSVTPHYLMKMGRWTLDAGFRISAIIRPKDDPQGLFAKRGQVAYPEIKAYYSVIPDAMRAYAHITGGNKLNTYASLLDRNHHVDPRYAAGRADLMNVTVERVSSALGVEGRIGPNFSYDLRGGYACYGNGLFDAVGAYVNAGTSELQYVPAFGYSPYQRLFAAMDWLLMMDSMQFDGTVQYQHVWGIRNADCLLAPAALAGDVNFEYNWNKRIFAGVDCEFSTGRKGSVEAFSADVVIPGYVDLGVNFEYAVSRAVSVWARGGNLLHMSIQRNPFYAQKGPSFTAGICLNL